MDTPINYVELTKTRLASLCGVVELKTLVLEVFFESCDIHSIYTKENDIEKKLSPAMRDVVLQELLGKIDSLEKGSAEVQQLAKLVPYLMNSMTKKLDLRKFVIPTSSVHNNVKTNDELLYAALYQAPNLEQLFYRRVRLLRYSDFAGHSSLLGSLSSFKNLQILDVQDLTVNLKNIMILCRRLSNLRVLNVDSVNYCRRSQHISEEQISRSFGNLRLICVASMDLSSHKGHRIILSHLPNLDTVPDLQYSGLTYEDFLYPEVKGQNESQRKMFTCDQLWFENADADIHLKHPNVLSLKVYLNGAIRVDDPHLLLPNFANIKSLVINSDCYFDDDNSDSYETHLLGIELLVNNIILKFGKHLHSLTILSGYDEIFYNVQRFFEHCPALEKLTLSRVDAEDRNLQLDNYSNLQELYMHNIFLFPNLLMAPKLRKVEIMTQCMSCNSDMAADLKTISSLIAEKYILLELQVLNIDFWPELVLRIFFLNLIEMIKNASAFLPKLVDLKLTVGGENYEILARKMKNSDEYKSKTFSRFSVCNDVKEVFVDDELIETLALYRNRKCAEVYQA